MISGKTTYSGWALIFSSANWSWQVSTQNNVVRIKQDNKVVYWSTDHGTAVSKMNYQDLRVCTEYIKKQYYNIEITQQRLGPWVMRNKTGIPWVAKYWKGFLALAQGGDLGRGQSYWDKGAMILQGLGRLSVATLERKDNSRKSKSLSWLGKWHVKGLALT